jgi:hypothetical protein
MNPYERRMLLRKCNLPDVKETEHCFADSTHHTCCMLGKQARDYAEKSGNPIGRVSEKLQPANTKLTPWCTCTGSKVCTYYQNKFGKTDGTYIKFINNLSEKDEAKALTKLRLSKHTTPGINF